MTRPGDRLRSFARRFCEPQTMERLIDPVIADLQCEHGDAIRRGQIWRGRRALVNGYMAFWKVVAIGMGGAATRTLITADAGAVGRIIRFSGIATTVIVGIMMWPPLRSMRHPFAGKMTLLVVYLLPQALSLALPMGLVFGVMCGLRGRVPTRRSQRAITLLMLATCLAALVIDGWIVPVSNQAFRELSFGGRIVRGVNELTLGELWQSARERFVIPAITNRRVFEFHFRLAAAFAPLALGLFSLAVATATRRASRIPAIGALAVVSCFAYYTLLYFARFSEIITPMVAAWGPNLVFLAVALLLRRMRPTNPDTLCPASQSETP